MQGRPIAVDGRIITAKLPESLIAHLDQQAAANGLSRAWYLRQIVSQDLARVRRSRKAAA